MTSERWVTCLLILVTITWRLTVVSCMEVIGKTETCDNEGEQVHLDKIDKQKCYFCICRNGYVECERSPVCPEIQGCHMIVEKTPEHCCAKCKGCYYNGTYYESGEEWISKHDPCMSLRCEAGVITKSRIHCHVPCDNPTPPGPGQCCPKCADCRLNGYIATDDRDVTPGDLCVKCRCFHGHLTCAKKACPVLQCPLSEQTRTIGECCPACKGNRSARMEVAHACMLQDQLYLEGNTTTLPGDHCTKCTCTHQTSICERETCPALDCSPVRQRKRPNTCCKECIDDYDYDDLIAEVQSQCIFNGKTYKEDQTWSLDACTKCSCKGKITCMKTTCNESLSCAIGSHLVHEKGECCKKCVENKMEATCVVFGNSHYRTFDGKMYTFQGLGKYQFVSDCVGHSFSIRITNDFSNRNKSSVMTKRVRIKYGDARVNLGQNCRVKLNGSRLTTSVNRTAINIIKDEHDIKVTLNHSIHILWNCHSYLEVTIPTHFKNKVCGLCGNFNFNVQDDLKKRKGGVVTDIDIKKFGRSWCVGKECLKDTNRMTQIQQCQLKSKNIACSILTSSEKFTGCHKKLNYYKYQLACVQDMCDCPSGKCYCDALTAYAQECKRLGVAIDQWQNDFLCTNNTYSFLMRKHHKKNRKHAHLPPVYSQDDIDRFVKSHRKRPDKGNIPIIH